MSTEPATTQAAPQDDDALTGALADAICEEVFGVSREVATNREAVLVMARNILAAVGPQLDAESKVLEARIDDLCDALSAYAPGHPLLLEGHDDGH